MDRKQEEKTQKKEKTQNCRLASMGEDGEPSTESTHYQQRLLFVAKDTHPYERSNLEKNRKPKGMQTNGMHYIQ